MDEPYLQLDYQMGATVLILLFRLDRIIGFDVRRPTKNQYHFHHDRSRRCRLHHRNQKCPSQSFVVQMICTGGPIGLLIKYDYIKSVFSLIMSKRFYKRGCGQGKKWLTVSRVCSKSNGEMLKPR
jgi:hypothetical protein